MVRCVFFIGLFFLAVVSATFGQTTNTSGNWNDPTIWTGGVPNGGSGTTGAPVSVGHSTFINQTISITTGVYYMGWTGSVNSNTNSTDVPGDGNVYNLSVASGGGYSATQSILDVKSGVTTFTGTGYFDNSNVIIQAGASLVLGATTIDNHVVFDVYGTLIINGDFDLYNNGGATSSFTIRDGGLVLVYGNFEAPVGGVAILGGGDIFSTGTMSTQGSSTIFGEKGDCAAGPCSGRNLCVLDGGGTIQNSVSTAQVLCSGIDNPVQLTSTTSPGATIYQWQTATSLDAFKAYPGTSDIASAITGVYTPLPQATTTALTDFYRLYIRVPRAAAPGYCEAYSSPVQLLTLGSGGWVSNTNTGDANRDDWNVASNWCGGGVPGSLTDVFILSFPSGSTRQMPKVKTGAANVKSISIGSGLSNNGVSTAALTLNSGGVTLNIHGTSTLAETVFPFQATFANNATFTSAADATVAFVGSSDDTHFQAIGGTSFNTFGNLILNNGGATTGPHYLLKNSIVVQGTLTFSKGKLNLNGATLQLGTSATSTGTLTYTAGGWMYGGSLQRYFGTAGTTLATGLFPLGLSTDYRPFAVSYSSALTTGGYIRVSHTGTIPATYLDPADFADGAFTIKRTSEARWSSSANGLTGGGTSITIEAGGTSFSNPAVLSDFRITLATTVAGLGSNGTSSGSASDPRIQRTGLDVGDLTNTFYLGTINEVATPLPIKLISFSANRKVSSVELLWNTKTEENLDFFEVERSTNGKDFSTLGVVSGNGTTNEEHAYNLFDEKPTVGKNYYRLKSVDFDGYTEYFNVVMVDFDGSKSFSIAPNPSDGITFTAHTNFTPATRAYVAIYTTLGVEVARYELAGDKSILTLPVKLESGIYFAKYVSNDFTSTNRVVVK